MPSTTPGASLRSVIGLIATVLTALVLCAEAQAQVVISQVYGGGGNSGAPYTNDFVELHNTGTSPVSLGGWSIQYTSATGTSWGTQKTNLPVATLPAGGYFLVQMASGGANGIALPTADATGTTNMSATAGKVALVNSTVSLPASICPSDPTIVDLVGYGSTANCSETAPASAPSSTVSLQRNTLGCSDSNNNATDFSTAAPNPRNSASAPQVCSANQPIVTSCNAFNTVQGIAGSSLISAIDSDGLVNGASITAGAVPGIALGTLTSATSIGGTASLRVEVANTIAPGTYPITVTFTNSDPQSTACIVSITVLTPPSALTTIPTIQGSGLTSPLIAQSITTRGVVTGVFPGLQGYYIQDETGDGDTNTSDGLFVYNASNPITVVVGERLQVTGTVTEFAGFAGNPTITELTSPSNVAKLGLGSIAPTLIALPEANEGDLERYEGMLVQITGTLTVSQNFFQGRYGQVTLSANGRMTKPTNVFRPGTPEANNMALDNAKRRIVLDDGKSAESLFSGVENPNPIPYIGVDNTLRAGDTVSNLVGIIDYGRITSATGVDAIVDYKLHPVLPPLFVRSNARQASPPSPGGTHRVASFNVLNYFTTFSNGNTAGGLSGQGCLPSNTTADCRGADSAAEFTRQRDKIIRAIAAINADVVGLMEIQRNGGVAAQNLVDGLNAFLGSTVYARVPDPANVGTDAIQVAMIYKVGTLTLSGAALSDTNPIHNRPPMAQTFQAANGAKFSVLVNHFKSKSCTSAAGLDLDQGDGQGCYNDRRKQQASALLNFISNVKVAAGDNDVLIIGDLNAYAREDPVDILTSNGLQDQNARFSGFFDYSYVFDGEAGYIDHALSSTTLASQITGAVHWKINADEPSIIDYNTEFKPQDLYSVSPYRSSDHDPVVVGLDLAAPAQPQTISFGPLAARYLDESPISINATASSGLPVQFTSLTSAICTVSGTTVTLMLAGNCQIAADQVGNVSYLPATQVTQTFAVNPARLAQSILFFPIATQVLGSAPFSVNITASSGLLPILTSQTPATCTASGTLVTVVDVGTCIVTANQSGNATYAVASPVTRAFAISAPTAGGNNGDVPLPLWAIVTLGGTLLGLGRRALR